MNIIIWLQAMVYCYRFRCIPKDIFKISGVCFKIKYQMTNQSLFSTFKHNIFLVKIIANIALKMFDLCLGV